MPASRSTKSLPTGREPAGSDDSADETGSDDSSTVAEAAQSAAAEAPRSTVSAPVSEKDKKAEAKEELRTIKSRLSSIIDELTSEYASSERGMEIRQIAGGYRMATKPEHHDVVVNFAKSLKPPVRLSLQALETLAVIAYKQPVTVPEISEIRGVDTSGVIATLLDRKLVTTAGRKQVIGRPILYRTTKEFLLRFGLNDVSELPSMEEFEKLGDPQADLFAAASAKKAETSAELALKVATDEPEPVTEAVPEDSAANPLKGDTTIPADGTYATEAEAGSSPEKS